MKFEAGPFTPPVIEKLENFWDHYRLVIKFLLDFNQNRLNLDTDIQSASLTVNVPHNTKFTINHGNKNILSRVNYSGRILMFRVLETRVGAVDCVAKLLTTDLIVPLRINLVSEILVTDPSFFVKGDVLAIGTQTRKIANISGNRITLDQSIVSPDTYVVSLAVDSARVTVF